MPRHAKVAPMSDEVELYVTFPNGRELLYMTPLGDNQFRLEVTALR